MPNAIPADRPFTLAEARALGISRAQIRGALERSEVTRVAHGLYAPGRDMPRDIVRPTRAVAAGFMATSHLGAAQVHGLLTPPEPHASMRSPIRIARIPMDHRYRLQSLRLAGSAWTAVNLARFQLLPAALVPLDSALRSGVPRAELMDVVHHMAGWPGSRGLVDAVAHADAGAESALESLARGQCIRAGLPLPTLQQQVVVGRRRYRLDLLWPTCKVVLEVDGLMKYGNEEAMLEEKRRHNALQSAGFTVLRCGFVNLYPSADALMAQLRRIVSG